MAIDYLESISPSYYDYPDVLLAMGWTALKLQNYQKALIVLNRLVEDYPDNLHMREAHFVLGQCYLKLGYYAFAIKEYEHIIQATPPTNNFRAIRAQIAEQRKHLQTLRTDLLLLESRLLETIPMARGNGVPEDIVAQRERLHQRRENIVRQLVEERRIFNTVAESLERLEREVEKREMQKDWRAYAEYGKARAVFLKGMQER